jgi:hypothetical protein
MVKRFRWCVLLLLLVGASVNADEWVLKPEFKESAFVFGRSRIVLLYDSTQNRAFPKYTLRVYHEVWDVLDILTLYVCSSQMGSRQGSDI